jgi:ferredoxin
MAPEPGRAPGRPGALERQDLAALFAALQARGYTVVGPTLRDGAIVLDELTGVDDLPAGWRSVQEGGIYRLERRDDGALFADVVGPHSWKKFLLPSELLLWKASRATGTLEILPVAHEVPRLAFLGVRPCDVAAIRIQDRIFCEGPFADDDYATRRAAAFIVAVNCTAPGHTCFCASVNTGPAAAAGFDLALTELRDGDRHLFLVEAGSPAGEELCADLPLRPAIAEEVALRDRLLAQATAQMGRTLDTTGLPDLLYRNLEHAQWDDVAARCLTCGNCSLVCPTCFCTTIEDVTDLTGQEAARWRKQDTCFSVGFSHVYGGSIRATAKARYRQWLTHKLAGWVEQFGMLGCVGCGRCITWCPVGIDLTAEVRAIRQTDRAAQRAAQGAAQGAAQPAKRSAREPVPTTLETA